MLCLGFSALEDCASLLVFYPRAFCGSSLRLWPPIGMTPAQCRIRRIAVCITSSVFSRDLLTLARIWPLRTLAVKFVPTQHLCMEYRLSTSIHSKRQALARSFRLVARYRSSAADNRCTPLAHICNMPQEFKHVNSKAVIVGCHLCELATFRHLHPVHPLFGGHVEPLTTNSTGRTRCSSSRGSEFMSRISTWAASWPISRSGSTTVVSMLTPR